MAATGGKSRGKTVVGCGDCDAPPMFAAELEAHRRGAHPTAAARPEARPVRPAKRVKHAPQSPPGTADLTINYLRELVAQWDWLQLRPTHPRVAGLRQALSGQDDKRRLLK